MQATSKMPYDPSLAWLANPRKVSKSSEHKSADKKTKVASVEPKTTCVEVGPSARCTPLHLSSATDVASTFPSRQWAAFHDKEIHEATTDIVLLADKSSDKYSVRAHRWALAILSKALKTLLITAPSLECRPTERQLRMPCDAPTLDTFLNYVYDDNMDQVWQRCRSCLPLCCSLLELAHGYELPELAQLCLDAMSDAIVVSDSEQVKLFAQFVQSQTGTPHWQQLNHLFNDAVKRFVERGDCIKLFVLTPTTVTLAGSMGERKAQDDGTEQKQRLLPLQTDRSASDDDSGAGPWIELKCWKEESPLPVVSRCRVPESTSTSNPSMLSISSIPSIPTIAAKPITFC